MSTLIGRNGQPIPVVTQADLDALHSALDALDQVTR